MISMEGKTSKLLVSARLFWPDAMRVIATFFVIVIHAKSLPPTTDGVSYIPYTLFALSKTSVPLFFMLSGALLLGKNGSPVSFYKKRLMRLVYPWLFWTLFFVLWSVFFRNTEITSLGELVRLFYVGLLTGLWFLPIIVGVYLLTPVYKNIIIRSSGKTIAIILVVWFVLFSYLPYFLPKISLFESIPIQILAYSGYYLLGYVIIKENFSSIRIGILVSLGGMLLSLLSFWLARSVQNSVSLQTFEYLFPGTVIASVGVFIVLYSFFRKQQYNLSSKSSRLFHGLSVLSLGILFLHQFLLELGNRYFPLYRKEFILDGLVKGVLLFSISAGIIWSLRKVPLLRKFVT